MARRSGLTTLRTLAIFLCKAVGRFRPAIITIYPGNPTLIAALDAAVIACQVLVEEATLVLPVGD